MNNVEYYKSLKEKHYKVFAYKRRIRFTVNGDVLYEETTAPVLKRVEDVQDANGVHKKGDTYKSLLFFVSNPNFHFYSEEDIRLFEDDKFVVYEILFKDTRVEAHYYVNHKNKVEWSFDDDWEIVEMTSEELANYPFKLTYQYMKEREMI